jgi:hypothetical protein
MDYRQKEIIKTWFEQGEKAGFESYFGFISYWISFNAYCVAKYSKQAQRRLAQINKDRGFKELSEGEVDIIEGSISETNGRYSIDIQKPGRIHIVIKEKFIESAVFDTFANKFQNNYEKMLEEGDFTEAVNELHKALKKDDGYSYVINMSKAGQYDPKISYSKLKEGNIIVPFENIEKLKQLIDVLYQIRCNLFHGEKQPGVINDDRIISSANPVLGAMLVGILLKEVLPNDAMPTASSAIAKTILTDPH